MRRVQEILSSASCTILCMGAHSDDIEIGCGGTVLRLLEQAPNARVVWVVLSARGSRREETCASADAFLSTTRHELEVGQFEDRFFPDQLRSIKEYFDDLASRVSPDLVFTHRREDRHQDHRVVAELTWNTFRDHLVLEYDIPKYEGDLGHPNVFVELPRTTCEQKVDRLMRSFGSQRHRHWFSDETFWSLLRLRGIECRSATGYAEGFVARKLLLA